MSTLVTGFQHVATVTNDLDRLIAFYEDVFEAKVKLVLPIDEGVPASRHALIEIGPGMVLHPFERAEEDLDQWGMEIVERGRVDHFGIMATDLPAFEEIKRRLIERGATDGTVTDFVAMLSVGFTDPDGTRLEVCWVRPDIGLEHGREPEGFQPYRRGTAAES